MFYDEYNADPTSGVQKLHGKLKNKIKNKTLSTSGKQLP